MSVFYYEESPNPSKKCKFLSAALKDAFSNCGTFNEQHSTSNPDDDNQLTDIDDEQEVVISEIRTRAMEKLRRRVFSPAIREMYVKLNEIQHEENNDHENEEENEEFLSVRSCLSYSSSVASREAFLSAKTDFSRCLSLNELDFQDLWTRSIIQEFCHCEGWPFGLCRKATLLPPLPKSPSESWLWRKGTRLAKLP